MPSKNHNLRWEFVWLWGYTNQKKHLIFFSWFWKLVLWSLIIQTFSNLRVKILICFSVTDRIFVTDLFSRWFWLDTRPYSFLKWPIVVKGVHHDVFNKVGQAESWCKVSLANIGNIVQQCCTNKLGQCWIAKRCWIPWLTIKVGLLMAKESGWFPTAGLG